jgi:hypothetical protein
MAAIGRKLTVGFWAHYRRKLAPIDHYGPRERRLESFPKSFIARLRGEFSDGWPLRLPLELRIYCRDAGAAGDAGWHFPTWVASLSDWGRPSTWGPKHHRVGQIPLNLLWRSQCAADRVVVRQAEYGG